MAYNLPPAWDPGYAIPDNVRDEGLERRGFVTKWAPRGTYDAPKVSTGGYVVPQYVLDEDYGQGTFTTKWVPRGTYAGPRIPQWINRQPTVVAQRSTGRRSAQVTFQRQAASGFGDDQPLPQLYQDYGQRAAATILATVQRVMPAQRKAELKKLMDRIDPSLWARTAKITRNLMSAGLTAAQVFPTALARSLSAGIAAEIVNTGQTRRAPQANSLLGLGCYGCHAALGATPNTAAMAFMAPIAATVAAPATTSNSACGNPPPGYSWNGTNWERARVGVAGSPFPGGGSFCIDQRTGQPVGVTAAPRGGTTPKMQIGPFVIDADLTTPQIITANSPSVIPPSWVPVIVAAVTNPKWVELGKKMGSLFSGFTIKPAPTNVFWQALGIAPGQNVVWNQFSPAATMGKWSDKNDDLAAPIMTFTHPVSGNTWGVFVAMLPTKENPQALQIYFKWLPEKPWYTAALDWILSIPAKLVDLTGDALSALKDLACKVATSPAGPAAGAAAGIAAGGPAGAKAGVAGAQVAAGMCTQPVAPLPPPMPSSNLLPLAIVGGGALLAILLSKKKASP